MLILGFAYTSFQFGLKPCEFYAKKFFAIATALAPCDFFRFFQILSNDGEIFKTGGGNGVLFHNIFATLKPCAGRFCY